jgi:hypothetical protein
LRFCRYGADGIPGFRAPRLLILLVWWLAVINVPSTSAMGPVFLPTSFEELVGDSTLIITGRIQSTAKQDGWPAFTRRTTVEVLKVLKGDPTIKVIVISHEVSYPTINVSLTEGRTYLLFLRRYKNESFFRYVSPPFWASWEVVGDQLANRQPGSDNVTRVPTNSFLGAINSEMHRTSKPVPKEFVRIEVGSALPQATQSSGLEFVRYDMHDSEPNWARYYSLPQNRAEHLVTLDLYKGRIIYLHVYLLRDCGDCSAALLRNLELKCGGVPLEKFGELSFELGRMWTDRNVELRVGSISFFKANGYPWGEFDAHEITITDRHVLHEYQSDNLKKSPTN